MANGSQGQNKSSGNVILKGLPTDATGWWLQCGYFTGKLVDLHEPTAAGFADRLWLAGRNRWDAQECIHIIKEFLIWFMPQHRSHDDEHHDLMLAAINLLATKEIMEKETPTL